jgi:long-subunit fatty acid transport protein
MAAAICASVAAGTQAASAGGIERNAPSTRILFEEGRYLEFSFNTVGPDLAGAGGNFAGPTPAAANGTGDIFESYSSFGVGYKADINENWSYALSFGQPWGVDTLYPLTAGSLYSGTAANLDSAELSATLAYDVTPGLKLYGGLRAQRVEAEALFPFAGFLGLGFPTLPGTYQVKADSDYGFGYLVGAAYSRPDIALRVGLTYYSEIRHTHDTTETVNATVTSTRTDITTPDSLNLDFQTGIAKDTLLFGQVRWVDWSEFEIAPPTFTNGNARNAPLVAYEKDWTTYTLGIGRRFSDKWSGAIQVSHEPATNTGLTTLGPVDGRTAYGLAATYTEGRMKVTAGLSYISLGEAQNFAATEYSDGDALAFGMRIGLQL